MSRPSHNVKRVLLKRADGVDTLTSKPTAYESLLESPPQRVDSIEGFQLRRYGDSTGAAPTFVGGRCLPHELSKSGGVPWCPFSYFESDPRARFTEACEPRAVRRGLAALWHRNARPSQASSTLGGSRDRCQRHDSRGSQPASAASRGKRADRSSDCPAQPCSAFDGTRTLPWRPVGSRASSPS